MRVAITGASGFFGTHLVAELEERGHTILRVLRDPAGDLAVPDEGERAEALVHLAFPTDARGRRAHPIATLGAVVRNAADAAAIAERLGATHLVLASTGKVFGAPTALPLADDATAHPTTQLGELKLLAEGIFGAAARAGQLGATALRVFNAYGPGQPASFLVPTLLAGIDRGALSLGELDHARDWIHVTDVARAFACALEAAASPGEVRAWSVGSGKARSVRDLLDVLRRAGATVPEPTFDASKLRPREAPEERASCEGLRAHGWAPRVALEAALAELLAPSAPRDTLTDLPLRTTEPSHGGSAP